MISRSAFALFVLFSLVSPAIAQDPPAISQTNPATPSEAPFLLPADPGAAAPIWLTLDCSQFDHGLCHYIPDPNFPNDCCIPSPKRLGCVSYCTE